MEVMPTKAEVAELAKKAGDKGFLLFPEDRRDSIRMLDSVPFKWPQARARPSRARCSRMTAPKLDHFQGAQVFDPATTDFTIPKDKGLILLLEES